MQNIQMNRATQTMDLNDSYEKVRQFHIAFNHECPSNPEMLPEDRVKKRYNWMLEELEELEELDPLEDQLDEDELDELDEEQFGTVKVG